MQTLTPRGATHYSMHAYDSIDEVREVFGNPDIDWTLNWLFLSTSGVHGTYTTLDDWEDESGEIDGTTLHITVLAVFPRIVKTVHGHLAITADDVPWLREAVRRTIEGVAKSQEGNT